MDNYTLYSNGEMNLTMSGDKKLDEYLRIITDPKHKKGSITYNLEKMSFMQFESFQVKSPFVAFRKAL